MPLPTANAAYSRYREVMLQALESPNGISVQFPSLREAMNFRKMCFHIRSRDRQFAAKTMEPNQQHLAATAYDQLVLTVESAISEGFPLGARLKITIPPVPIIERL